ncbi:riboflavin synthase [Haladaptatus sp. DYF46]|uniref:riboflavin synthase n=1 Tax=Haladaptatus sp. DYF46 TaxID=2886041 RepID=UPI001E47B760|nr:riboflavin synthase [Haladaptatus sp. DYF46]
MFTGIVAEVGEVRRVEESDGGRRLTIAADEVLSDVEGGASIAVNGACLTVEEFDGESFEVFLAAETVEKTYLGEIEEGDVVNLERALRADARLDGHFVQGHVDTTTEVVDVRQVGEDGEALRASENGEALRASKNSSGESPREDWEYEFALPEAFGQYIVNKGSVALDGISLTVAEKGEETFTVAIIPTTRRVTNLSEKEPGDPVHLEVDVLAKYAEELLAER